MSFRFIFHHAYPMLRHIARHMVVLVASSCPASPRTTRATHYVCFIHRRVVPLRSLFPPLQSRIFSFQTVVGLVVVVLAQRSKLASRGQAERYEGCFQGMLSMRPLSRNANRAMYVDLISYLIFVGGAPNRPLPPTPDEEESGDRTLVMKRVSTFSSAASMQVKVHICRPLLSSIRIYFISV